MKNQIINEIQRKMLPYLNNEQLLHLKVILETSLQGIVIEKGEEQSKTEEQDSAAAFITAKRIEGCSEKTLAYYSKTIEAMLNGVGKLPQQITTDDLRKYLTDYQIQRRSSKVTIDNIRRILSSFFSWLEDEDFIVKSPVRRIHKVKTAKIIKETYTDEALELMRDNCSTVRDLAIIDLLASSGMRVGELVTLNREDINFNEREWMFSGRCLRVRPTSEIDSEYLYYYFCLEETKQFVRNIAVGATMPSINTKLLGEVVVTFPELEQQKRISGILSAIDSKIEVNQKINDNLAA